VFFYKTIYSNFSANLKETLAGLAGALLGLVEELECSLLRLVSRREEVLDRLLSEHHLAAAYNASVLVEDEVLLGEAAAGVESSFVVNLCL